MAGSTELASQQREIVTQSARGRTGADPRAARDPQMGRAVGGSRAAHDALHLHARARHFPIREHEVGRAQPLHDPPARRGPVLDGSYGEYDGAGCCGYSGNQLDGIGV